MYGTLPRSFNSSEIAQQRSRRRRLLDVRHLNQYATFRLSPAEVGLIMPRQFDVHDSHQDLTLDEETMRATRFNSTQLSMSIDDTSDCDDSIASEEEKLRSLPTFQKPPPPPPRRKPESASASSTLSPVSSCGDERVRSLPSANVYKPLPPLPPASDHGSDNGSDDQSSSSSTSSTSDNSPGTSESPSTYSSKKLSVTFCETDVIAGPSKSSNLFKSMFQKKSVTTKNVAVTTSRLRSSPETSLSVTPTPILIPRPMAVERRHLPLAKRLSDKLKEPFSIGKNVKI